MEIYGVIVVFDDDREIPQSYYTTMEEAEKHKSYLESLPWCMQPGDCYKIETRYIREKFEPFCTEEEIEDGRKWDRENRH